jgi:hypothetical protein
MTDHNNNYQRPHQPPTITTTTKTTKTTTKPYVSDYVLLNLLTGGNLHRYIEHRRPFTPFERVLMPNPFRDDIFQRSLHRPLRLAVDVYLQTFGSRAGKTHSTIQDGKRGSTKTVTGGGSTSSSEIVIVEDESQSNYHINANSSFSYKDDNDKDHNNQPSLEKPQQYQPSGKYISIDSITLRNRDDLFPIESNPHATSTRPIVSQAFKHGHFTIFSPFQSNHSNYRITSSDFLLQHRSYFGGYEFCPNEDMDYFKAFGSIFNHSLVNFNSLYQTPLQGDVLEFYIQLYLIHFWFEDLIDFHESMQLRAGNYNDVVNHWRLLPITQPGGTSIHSNTLINYLNSDAANNTNNPLDQQPEQLEPPKPKPKNTLFGRKPKPTPTMDDVDHDDEDTNNNNNSENKNNNKTTHNTLDQFVLNTSSTIPPTSPYYGQLSSSYLAPHPSTVLIQQQYLQFITHPDHLIQLPLKIPLIHAKEIIYIPPAFPLGFTSGLIPENPDSNKLVASIPVPTSLSHGIVEPHIPLSSSILYHTKKTMKNVTFKLNGHPYPQKLRVPNKQIPPYDPTENPLPESSFALPTFIDFKFGSLLAPKSSSISTSTTNTPLVSSSSLMNLSSSKTTHLSSSTNTTYSKNHPNAVNTEWDWCV